MWYFIFLMMFNFGTPTFIDTPKDDSGIMMETGDDDGEFPPGPPPSNGDGN